MGKTSRRNHLPERAEVEARAAVLLEALPFIQQFAGATVVVKYGGAAMTKPELKASFARDIALLKLVGLNPVVVHGGGPDISKYSERLGLDVNFVDGLRVTDEPTMELVKMVLIGKINKEIVAQLHVAGIEAVGLSGDDGRLIEARKATSDSGDLGFVGDVARINPDILSDLGRFVPVVASVGVDAQGQSYNINADTVAGALAKALGARRVIFLTDVEGVYEDFDDKSTLIGRCSLADIEAMLEAGDVDKGMIPKLSAVCDALKGGVEAAQIVDGRVPHSVIMELFTEEGLGTMVTRA
ncbi:MAG: acetylglutamate kinase [Actinobacteria bacterium]|nr:acetylglutamate kinase [Actinomycetota bacterium]